MSDISCTPSRISGFECHAVTEPSKPQIIQQIRDLVRGLSPHGRFPGPNPCSLERADLKSIRAPDNWLCEKTDGTRVLLAFLVHNGLKIAVFVTRAWGVYLVGLKQIPKVLFQGTVFDGELVLSGGRWLWLGFDAMIVAGIPVYSMPLSARLEAAHRSMKEYCNDPRDPIFLKFKRYFKTFPEYRQYLDHTTHPVDGTIVTPEHTPVVLGRHTTLFKLKDGGRHTVDFEFSLPDVLKVYDPHRGTSVPVARLALDASSPPGGCIIEAAWRDGEYWTLVTIRQDKTTSNDMLTYTKTMVNIRENLGLHDLEAHWV